MELDGRPTGSVLPRASMSEDGGDSGSLHNGALLRLHVRLHSSPVAEAVSSWAQFANPRTMGAIGGASYRTGLRPRAQPRKPDTDHGRRMHR
jgi:hypothetical protein